MTMSLHPFDLPAAVHRPAGPGPIHRIRTALAALRDAHEARRRHVALGEAALRDAAMAAEDILGHPARQDALPFFMQAGFQGHRLSR